MNVAPCAHAPPTVAEPSSASCRDCGADEQLRSCASCGFVGCADSRHGHMSAHCEAEGHPVIREVADPEDAWTYCHTCEAYL